MPYFERKVPLTITNQHTKFEDNRMKFGKVIELFSNSPLGTTRWRHQVVNFERKVPLTMTNPHTKFEENRMKFGKVIHHVHKEV